MEYLIIVLPFISAIAPIISAIILASAMVLVAYMALKSEWLKSKIREREYNENTLNGRRVEAVLGFSNCLAIMSNALRSFCNALQCRSSDKEEQAKLDQEQAQRVREFMVDASNYLEANKILFPRKITVLARGILTECNRKGFIEQLFARNIGIGGSLASEDAKNNVASSIKSYEFVSERLFELEEELENEFRKMLGVDENNERISK